MKRAKGNKLGSAICIPSGFDFIWIKTHVHVCADHQGRCCRGTEFDQFVDVRWIFADVTDFKWDVFIGQPSLGCVAWWSGRLRVENDLFICHLYHSIVVV